MIEEITSINHMPPENDYKEPDHCLWKGFRVASRFAYELPAKIFGIFAAAIGSHLLALPIATSLYVLGVSTLLTKLVVKITSTYNWEVFQKIERNTWDYKSTYPYLQTASLVGGLILSFLIPAIGVFICTGLGIFNGIIIEVEHCRKLQDVKRRCTQSFHTRGLVEIVMN